MPRLDSPFLVVAVQVTPGEANKGLFIDLKEPSPGAGEVRPAGHSSVSYLLILGAAHPGIPIDASDGTSKRYHQGLFLRHSMSRGLPVAEVRLRLILGLQISDNVLVTCRGARPGKKLKTIIEYKDEVIYG